jgi:hypothetical protein
MIDWLYQLDSPWEEREKLTSTYRSKDCLKLAPTWGKIVPLAPPSGISLFSERVSGRLIRHMTGTHTQVLGSSKGVVLVKQGSDVGVVVPDQSAHIMPQNCKTYSFPRDRMIRIPPRATSLNRTWKPRKSAPTTKNMPKGFLGYSTSGKKDGSNRKERATSVYC